MRIKCSQYFPSRDTRGHSVSHSLQRCYWQLFLSLAASLQASVNVFLHSRSEWVVGKWEFFKFATGRPAGRPSESAIGNMRFRTVRFWQPRPLFLFFGKHFNHPHPLNFDWMFLQLGHGASAFLGCSLAFVPTRGRVFIINLWSGGIRDSTSAFYRNECRIVKIR